MKKLQIIADSSQLDSLVGILNQNAVRHFTVTELKEFGLAAQYATSFRGQTQPNRFKARVEVEAILTAEAVQDVVAALRKSVPPAQQPEVYVSPVECVDMTAQPKTTSLAGAGLN